MLLIASPVDQEIHYNEPYTAEGRHIQSEFREIGMSDRFRLERWKDLLFGGPRPDRQTAGGVTEFACPTPDAALAVCTDALRPDVERVEVRIGRDLAAKTNPEVFKRNAHHAARRFVRNGLTSYALSCDWADALDRQDKVFVRVIQRTTASRQGGKTRALSEREIGQIRGEIAAEIKFAVEELAKSTREPVVLSGMTVVCRDTDAHSWLSHVAADSPAFTRSVISLAEPKARAAPDFAATYRFESALPNTTAVGQGLIAIELQQHATNLKPTASTAARAAVPARTATFEIYDESTTGGGQTLLVTFLGLGREMVTAQSPISLDLPAVINRQVLSATALSQHAANLLLVSESNPLQVKAQGGHLCLAANARRGRNGIDRPGYFLIDGEREIPIVGERIIATDSAEVVIGSESHRSGRAPDGTVLRPPRIRLVLDSSRSS